jgi:hypothetical protein
MKNTQSITAKIVSRSVGVACLLALLAALMTPSAVAKTEHSPIGSFGSDGTAATAFPYHETGFPTGRPAGNNQLAFDQAGEHLLVLTARVDKSAGAALGIQEGMICRFGALDQGTFEAPPAPFAAPSPGDCDGDGSDDDYAIGPLALGNLPFSSAASIALDNTLGPAADSIYVAATKGPLVYGFDSGGQQLGGEFPLERETSFDPGVAVDSTGHVWVANGLEERAEEYTPNGAATGRFASTVAQGSLQYLAFDSQDNLYVLFHPNNSPKEHQGGEGKVWKYSAASGYTESVLIDGGVARAIAVDTAADHLFVAHDKDVVEYDVSGGAVIEVSTFATGIASSDFRGVAVDEDDNPEATTVYVSDSGNAKIHVFGTTITEPGALTDSASNRTATGATLEGAVNPKGKALSDCHFEYVSEDAFVKSGFDDLSSGGLAPCATADGAPIAGPGDIPADENAHTVTAEISGLAPATRYRHRLLATSSEGTGAGKGVAFATLGPLISATRVSDVTFSEAILTARVNPQGQATAYRFEYVDDATCQEDLEAEGSGHCFDRAERHPDPESAPIGADEAEHPVGAALTGLAPGTLYRFRAVALNADATGIGLERTFATHAPAASQKCPNDADRIGPSEALPECRAYEQVSPLDKGSADASFRKAQAAASGEGLVFPATVFQTFPGDLGNSGLNPYLARRGTVGAWSTKGLVTALEPAEFNNNKYRYLALSEDLSRMALNTHASLGVPGDGDGLYLRDNVTDSHEEVTGTSGGDGTATEPLTGELMERFAPPLLASPDLSHLVFESEEKLTEDAGGVKSGKVLFEWSEGALSIVSRLPGTDKPVSGCISGTHVIGLGGQQQCVADTYRDHAVSTDGARVFWHGIGVGGKDTLYVRLNGAETVDIGLSERTSPDPEGPREKRFVEASADGAKAFFVSTEKLTDDSTATGATGTFGSSGYRSGELYRYDFSLPEGERLTDITVAPGEPGGARVQGAIGASGDGERLYFVALGDLAEGAVSGEPNLYLWDRTGGVPFTRHIATLAEGSQVDRDNLAVDHSEVKTAMVDRDGEHLVFLSAARLTSADNANRAAVYLYDAVADRLTCVSCDPSGEAASAPASLGETGQGIGLVNHQNRNLSADGSRVFFETADSLLPADTNGRTDVYLWHDGKLDLISTGRSGADSHFADASESGDDVFFATREQLSPLDEDSLVDVYDARVNGIAAKPRPPRPECLGEACQPAAIVPDDPSPASSGFRGQGNPSATGKRPGRCPKGKRKVRRGAKARCVKRGQRQRLGRANVDRRASQ